MSCTRNEEPFDIWADALRDYHRRHGEYTKRSDAQRDARRALKNANAQEGVEFVTDQKVTSQGACWTVRYTPHDEVAAQRAPVPEQRGRADAQPYKYDPARVLGRFLDDLQRSADHAATNPLRALSKHEKVILRRAAEDTQLYGGPLVTLLKDTPRALDMLGPLLSAARVIGWVSGPLETAWSSNQKRQAAIARTAPGNPGGPRAKATAERRARESDLAAAIKKALQSGEKRTNLAPAVNVQLKLAGHATVSETTIKRARRRMGLMRGKTDRS
jgi:hypothetical protein